MIHKNPTAKFKPSVWLCTTITTRSHLSPNTASSNYHHQKCPHELTLSKFTSLANYSLKVQTFFFSQKPLRKKDLCFWNKNMQNQQILFLLLAFLSSQCFTGFSSISTTSQQKWETHRQKEEETLPKKKKKKSPHQKQPVWERKSYLVSQKTNQENTKHK